MPHLLTTIEAVIDAAGLDLTCLCDIRIAAEQARFAECFVKRSPPFKG